MPRSRLSGGIPLLPVCVQGVYGTTFTLTPNHLVHRPCFAANVPPRVHKRRPLLGPEATSPQPSPCILRCMLILSSSLHKHWLDVCTCLTVVSPFLQHTVRCWGNSFCLRTSFVRMFNSPTTWRLNITERLHLKQPFTELVRDEFETTNVNHFFKTCCYLFGQNSYIVFLFWRLEKHEGYAQHKAPTILNTTRTALCPLDHKIPTGHCCLGK